MVALFSVLLFLYFPAPADEAPMVHEVTIQVTVPESTGPVFLTGNLPELGPWQPELFLMEGDGRQRSARLKIPHGYEFLFKFTAGGWDREALNRDFSVPANHRLLVEEPGALQLVVERFRDPAVEMPYPDPARWEPAIEAFGRADSESMPPKGAVLAVGSSTIVLWRPTIADDLAPLTVIERGFGGAMVNDLAHYAERVIFPYEPRAIIVYIGENDIAGGVFLPTAWARYEALLAAIRHRLPQARLYLIGQKPSPSRERYGATFQELNALIEGWCQVDRNAVYIDLPEALLGADGSLRPELYVEDQLHLSPAGYEVLREVVRAVVLPVEEPHETMTAE
jgi:lysophospholipase L1-like esterase